MSERRIDALKCITFNDEYYLLYIPVYAYTQARTRAHAYKERQTKNTETEPVRTIAPVNTVGSTRRSGQKLV